MSEALLRVTRLVAPGGPMPSATGPSGPCPRWCSPSTCFAVIAADLAAIAVTAQHTAFSTHNLALFGLLLAARRPPSN